MLYFVNAKINIGLQIVRRREDGYHDLQTVFYPVGVYAATAGNPQPFCDILEIVKGEGRLQMGGRMVDCPLEKNLVYRAAKLFFDRYGAEIEDVDIYFEKHLPDGAGMGGGSADASFVLKGLAEVLGPGNKLSETELAEMALELGADCPFFIYNRPMYASGVGDKFEDINLDLSGKWLLAVKPKVSISTREAFAGITPKNGDFDLRLLPETPIEMWKYLVNNDFEESLFPKYPVLSELKDRVYAAGAQYASMTGSGSVFYGIFADEVEGQYAKMEFKDDSTIEGVWLLKM